MDPISLTDLVEAGRCLGHDLHDRSRLPLQPAWPAAVREGFLTARARGHRRPDPDRFTRKWLQLRLGALARGRVIADDVTPAAIRQLDTPRCPVTRGPLSAGRGTASDWSIDRLNNDGGYALANLAVMSVQATGPRPPCPSTPCWRAPAPASPATAWRRPPGCAWPP